MPYDLAVNLDAEEKFYIDLFSLRILSLLVCRGEVREKAEYLYDLVLKRNLQKDDELNESFKKKLNEEKLEFANGRLVRALKLLVYFSVVLPGAYMNYYENESVY